eukprot:Nitzschia sp. Nitz4//scaffold91_size79674//8876//15610//NITZ4_005356-RA/size79674-processed-gene-0.29-mRNA-1//1//CDS//3329560067//2530//frame0
MTSNQDNPETPMMAKPSNPLTDLQQRKEAIEQRLEEIGVGEAPVSLVQKAKATKRGSKAAKKSDAVVDPAELARHLIPCSPKSIDTHWDFVMKEMMWLGADFQGERKRQVSSAKRLASSVKQFHKTKETRRLRELHQAEMKRRKLAAKLSRDVKGWWSKIEKVIAYKQKIQADEERKVAMNKQLVVLVQQTEKYTESLANHAAVSETDGDDDDDESEMGGWSDGQTSESDVASGSEGGHRRRRHRMTIEEVLAAENKLMRKSKRRVIDYSRMRVDSVDFYGEATASDASGSDASYSPQEDSDDDSTLQKAIHDELLERHQDHTTTFLADPEELRKLREEMDMGVEKILERLEQEATEAPDPVDEPAPAPDPTGKHVHFAEVAKDTKAKATAESQSSDEPVKYDADDDGDASDVEDYNDPMDQGSDEEFQGGEPEVDDETTIAQEEALPREMSVQAEIALLQQEGELPIDELRAKYAQMNAEAAAEPSEEEESQGISVEDEVESDQEAEFEPPTIAEVDDETTIDAEEKLGREMTHEEEMEMLKKESEIPIEQLRAQYAAMNSPGSSSTDEPKDDPEDQSAEDSQEEFEFDPSQAKDDETTIEAEERLGRDMTYEQELSILKQDSEMSVEALREKYLGVFEQPSSRQGNDDPSEIGQTEEVESEDENSEDASVASNTAPLSLLAQGKGDTAFEDEGGEEYVPNDGDAIDDETTMEAEEKLQRDMSYEEEIALLQKENEMSVEELRKMYSQMEEEQNEDGDENMEEEDSNTDEESRKRRAESEAGSDRDVKRSKKSDGNDSAEDGLAAIDALEASAERAQQTLATRPFLLASWVKLRRYQQVGLNWLVSLQSRRLNGILADEMGLGKTLQTISLLSYLASYKGIWGPHLIVVPTSVIINWETELKRFCPALKVLCYYGSAKRRKELRQGWTKTNWYHVVITSYQLAVQDAFAFKRKKWYYLVLDEAQNIKNFQSQRWQTLIHFNTQRRLLLTGTPLQNSLMELWSLLHFLMPYIFRSRKEFSYWFSNPMNNIIEGNSDRNNDVIKRLHGIIRPFVLRRLKKDVETQMPGKYEHIVKCQLSRRQMTLYEEFLARSSTRQALQSSGNFMGMMNVLMQLRKVCNHPDLFEPRSVVTPFVLPGISLTIPTMICDARECSVLERVSAHLTEPLWCGSSSLPSLSHALRHDQIESSELRSLAVELPSPSRKGFVPTTDASCPDELRALVAEIYELRYQRALAKVTAQNGTNHRRCHSPAFAYPNNLLEAIDVECGVFQRSDPVELKHRNVLLTPQSLLNMRKNEEERSSSMEATIDHFVFCVPPAGAHPPVFEVGESSNNPLPTKNLNEMLLEPLEELMKPYRKAQKRISSFFPDKKLIQYDAGKLQTLAALLRDLKKGGHRALIFTQMSKMLDILEAFLNINGLTYLRLDGATGVDRRQRYMDRFNNDAKIFCFILSTRSGGMGINLTGADTVIFYDSDWNPAMDAQAQDRAHRIGQTRDVHIYRLITEHTIEENILDKANQKKNLDKMIMDQGKFDASHHAKPNNDDGVQDVYTSGGLREILGVSSSDPENTRGHESDLPGPKEAANMSKEQMELAMAALEDEDDVKALKGAQQEAAQELEEFDENAEVVKDSEGEDDGVADETPASTEPPKKKAKKTTNDKNTKDTTEETAENKHEQESELEKEFAAWQTSVGLDASAIEASLSPMEKYGMLFRENIDPFYSVFYLNELRRKAEATEPQDEIDIEELEHEKALEERQAIDDGDLLGTYPRPESLIRQRNLYRRERSRLRADKMRRKLTGANWSQRIDGLSKIPFWYNEDTGEAVWDKPTTLVALEAEDLAHQNGWGSLPINILVHAMRFLIPYPERQTCSLVCRQWKTAAKDISFVRHVYPVEMGALSRDPSRRDFNHYGSIDEALSISLPGDTIELSDGHYWVTDSGLLFDKPLKLIGDEHNPSNVVVELSGSITWSGRGGIIEGITLRRPKISTGVTVEYPVLQIMEAGRVDVVDSILDNDGSTGSVVLATGVGNKGQWKKVTIRNGGGHGVELCNTGVTLGIQKSVIRGNKGHGIHCTNKANFSIHDSVVSGNGGSGASILGEAAGEIVKCEFNRNVGGVIERAIGCTTTCSMNIAHVPHALARGIPGFRITVAGFENPIST